MPDQSSLLRSAVAAARREQEVIKFWLETRGEHPFGPEDARKISLRLSSWNQEVLRLLTEIENAIAGDRITEGWEKYTELRREYLARLSNELLAVIGGMFLMRYNFDSLRPADQPPLSFSAVAGTLLNELADRADRLHGSILIVGEELNAPTGAGIIRLRFPACDIWSLPFTAHEYGFLVAHREPPELFRQMKSTVYEMVDPTRHPDSGPPPDAACYIPQVQQFWEDFYYVHPEEAPGTVQLNADDRRRVEELRELQTAHLCRLFADAFATFFAGPAWVHVLLHLRFRPDETLNATSPTMPSFTSRLTFALETLRWMHDTRSLWETQGFETGPFAREFDDTATALDTHWAMVIQGAGCKDEYQNVAEAFRPWRESMCAALWSNDWQGRAALARTYELWRDAVTIEPVLREQNPQLPERPDPWAVLNAAWSNRVWQGPEMMRLVEANAIRLLDTADSEVIVPAPRKPTPGRSALGAAAAQEPDLRGEQQRRGDVTEVQRGLLGQMVLSRQFEWDVEGHRYPRLLPERTEIQRALLGNAEASQAYYRLVLGDQKPSER